MEGNLNKKNDKLPAPIQRTKALKKNTRNFLTVVDSRIPRYSKYDYFTPAKMAILKYWLGLFSMHELKNVTLSLPSDVEKKHGKINGLMNELSNLGKRPIGTKNESIKLVKITKAIVEEILHVWPESKDDNYFRKEFLLFFYSTFYISSLLKSLFEDENEYVIRDYKNGLFNILMEALRKKTSKNFREPTFYILITLKQMSGRKYIFNKSRFSLFNFDGKHILQFIVGETIKSYENLIDENEYCSFFELCDGVLCWFAVTHHVLGISGQPLHRDYKNMLKALKKANEEFYIAFQNATRRNQPAHNKLKQMLKLTDEKINQFNTWLSPYVQNEDDWCD